MFSKISSTMRIVIFLGVAVGCALGDFTIHAESIVPATADTYITQHSNLGGPNSVHGSDSAVFSIGTGGTGQFVSYPLYQFDLAGFANQTVVGTPRMELWLSGGHPGGNGVSRPVSVHESFVSWNEATVSLNTFGGSPGVQFGSDVGPALATEAVVWPAAGARYIAWAIPASIVQNWIDSPTSNRGLLVSNEATGFNIDLNFHTREGDPVPRLVFDVVPEPTCGLLALSGVSAVCLGIRRQQTRGAKERGRAIYWLTKF